MLKSNETKKELALKCRTIVVLQGPKSPATSSKHTKVQKQYTDLCPTTILPF